MVTSDVPVYVFVRCAIEKLHQLFNVTIKNLVRPFSAAHISQPLVRRVGASRYTRALTQKTTLNHCFAINCALSPFAVTLAQWHPCDNANECWSDIAADRSMVARRNIVSRSSIQQLCHKLNRLGIEAINRHIILRIHPFLGPICDALFTHAHTRTHSTGIALDNLKMIFYSSLQLFLMRAIFFSYSLLFFRHIQHPDKLISIAIHVDCMVVIDAVSLFAHSQAKTCDSDKKNTKIIYHQNTMPYCTSLHTVQWILDIFVSDRLRYINAYLSNWYIKCNLINCLANSASTFFYLSIIRLSPLPVIAAGHFPLHHHWFASDLIRYPMAEREVIHIAPMTNYAVGRDGPCSEWIMNVWSNNCFW